MDKKVDYIVFEGAMARAERIIKRLIIALIITALVFFGSNIGWLCYAVQQEEPERAEAEECEACEAYEKCL